MQSIHLDRKNYNEAAKQFIIFLRSKDIFLNRIFENEQISIVIWVLDGTIIWLNKYTQTMIGFTEEDLDGIINIDCIIPEDIICHIKEKISNMEDQKMQYESGCSLLSKDGREFYVAWYNYLLRDASKEYILSFGMDITNFRNAVKQLEEANSNLTAANEELMAQQEKLSVMNEKLMAQEDRLGNSLIQLQIHQEMLKKNGERYRLVVEGVYPDNAKSGKRLLKKADIAMYEAKKRGKNNLKYFNNNMSRKANSYNDIRKDLQTAIDNEEFFLCYQPIIDVRTKKVVCLEALIRWNHPQKGIISPDEFIFIAEDTRLIIPIGNWVLQTACRQLKEWHQRGYVKYNLSVNVSMIQLQQPNFAEVVGEILTKTGLLPKFLELEITESAFMDSTHTAENNLICLRKQGVKISIDDFGTGYNSLKYLQKLVVNSLKIDRTFIFNNKVNEVNKVIIDTVILLGHKINAEITAEGIETKEQYEYLKMKGCDKIQGYYISKPLLPVEVIEFFKENNN